MSMQAFHARLQDGSRDALFRALAALRKVPAPLPKVGLRGWSDVW